MTLLIAVAGAQVTGADGAAASSGIPAADLPDTVDTIFGALTTPDSSHPVGAESAEVGLRFTTVLDGVILGLRVYRPTGDTDAQPGTVWTADGQLMAQLQLPATSSAGWQFAAFDRPVPVRSDTIYVASYHAADGYTADPEYFSGGGTASGLIRPATRAGQIDPRNGVYSLGARTAFPEQTHNATNYWVDVVFLAGGGSPPPTIPPTTTPPTTTTTAPSPPPGPPPPPGVIPPNTLPQPGQVGFLGNPSTLTVIDSSQSAPPGTSWSNGTLNVSGADVTLDGVWIKGSVRQSGSGILRIRNSIVEANGLSWAVVMASGTAGARLDIRDSDLVWPPSVPAPGPTWGNGAVHGDADETLIRNDISGTPDGVQQAGGNSTYQQNYIHDLRMTGTYPNNTHNDGLQLYGGPNYSVQYNYIELNGYDGTHQNAAIFFSDDGNGSPSPQIIGNYISGGGFQLRLEAGTTNATVTDNIFGPINGGFAHANISPGASAAVWQRNVDTNGNPVPKP